MAIRSLPKKPKFPLGVRLRSKVSGFNGIATERITYINGCVRYLLVSGVNQTSGKIIDHYVYDNELEVVKE